MLVREWGKVLLFGVIGFAFAGISLIGNPYGLSGFDIAAMLIFSPVYGIGFCYGTGAFFRLIGTLFKWLGAMLFMNSFTSCGCGFGGCFEFIMRILMVVLLVGVIATLGWFVGIFTAAKRIKEAEETDMQFTI